MKKFVVLFALILHSGFAQTQWSVGFWTGANNVPITDLDWGGLTHIAHVAALPNADGSLTLTCGFGPCSSSQFAVEASALVNAAHANNVKALMDIGNCAGSRWSGAMSNSTTFLNNIMNVVNTYGYDGVDLDWEDTLNHTDMTALITGLRQRLGTKLLSANMGGGQESYFASVHSYLDRVSFMTYDMVGTWNPYSWFNSALYNDPCNCVWSVDLAKQRMVAAGVPASKLNIGIPFYGWTSSGGGSTGPRQPWGPTLPSLGQMNYNLIAANWNLSNPNWDSGAQVPWIGTGSGWVTFDNAQSITLKVNYAQNNNLGGWIIWALDQDYFPAQSVRHPLLAAVKSAMGVVSATPPTITTGAVLPGGTVGTAYSQTLAGTGTAPITWSGNSLPAGLSIGGSTGILSGTPVTAGTFSFTIQATNSAGSSSKTFSLTVNSAVIAPVITSVSPLGAGTVGVAYVQTLANSGSAASWSVISGALPGGLSLNSLTGLISGVPASAGTFTFTVQAANPSGSDAKTFSLTMNSSVVAPVITSVSPLAAGTAGTAYAQTLTSSGNTASWSVTSGALPGGLSLNSAGLLSGVPSAAGTFNFTVQASNTAGSNSRAFSLTIVAAPAAPNGNGSYDVSDLTWTSGSNGWGPIRVNTSTDGRVLTLNGRTYAKGLGAHANSQIVYNLGGVCSAFQADVGVDDEAGSQGSVVFQVVADGVKLFDSGKKSMTGTSATQSVNVSLNGRNQLVLIVNDGGNGNGWDHADWASPRLTCSSAPGGAPPPPPSSTSYFVSDLNWVSATNGWGPLQRNTSTDGNPLRLRGTSYAKGLGAHATSQVVFSLGGVCSSFQADVGVDDETGGNGSVAFQVLADGVSLYQSGPLTPLTSIQTINVPLAGRSQLTLIVTDGGDGINFDHADWANARVNCTSFPR